MDGIKIFPRPGNGSFSKDGMEYLARQLIGTGMLGGYVVSIDSDDECAATPTLLPMPFPLCRALSAKEPKPEPRRFVRWMNMYPGQKAIGVHGTKADANRTRAHDCIACLRIEFTEGQFDEPQPGDPV